MTPEDSRRRSWLELSSSQRLHYNVIYTNVSTKTKLPVASYTARVLETEFGVDYQHRCRNLRYRGLGTEIGKIPDPTDDDSFIF